MIFNLFLGISVLYLMVSYLLSRGLNSITTDVELNKPHLSVTVLISARNEERVIDNLLSSLKNLNYPEKLLSVTIINDRSTDSTLEKLYNWQDKLDNLKIIDIKETNPNFAPKKYAITKGVESSNSDIIIVTDADCIVPPNWINEITSVFEDKNVALVQGITKYIYDKSIPPLLFNFQYVDFLSHGIVAAAGIGANLPINSNANNFAYRRDIFNNLSGYGDMSTVVSGDDDLLLQRVWKLKDSNIKFLATERSTVKTEATKTFLELLEQRKRWGSKTVHYGIKQIIPLSIIFIFYIITALSFISSAIFITPIYTPILLLFIKLIGEQFFMIKGTKIFRARNYLIHTIWTSPIQLIVVLFSVFSGVFGKFTWKSSVFKREITKY